MVDDPRVNFAISTNAENTGIDHLGIQVEDQDELEEVYARLDQAGRPVLDVGRPGRDREPTAPRPGNSVQQRRIHL